MFWNSTTDHLFKQLQARPQGLSEIEATAQRKLCGPNVLKAKSRKWFLQFLARFTNPLVAILLVASAFSAATGDLTGFVLIWLIVLLSVTLDFFQQYRAEEAAEKLKKSVSVHATVVREGVSTEVPFADIVPGDIILLGAGDLVPADGVIIEAKDLFLNQSLVTGESYPVEKIKTERPNSSTEIGEAKNAVFMGSSVISGTARVLICQTGAKTFLGDISESLAQKAPPTAFDIGIQQFGMLIMRLTIALVLFVLLINTLLHRPLLESFLFAIALAVGLTPELLPMIITVTLSRGAMRMARQQVIVKKLSAIQNLGSMDVLCSDKTGTLTEGKIRLERHVDMNGNDNDNVLMLAYLNSYFETGLKNPMDLAILEHKEVDVSRWHKLDEVPFDFERRRISVLIDDGQQRWLVVKGAPDEILQFSKSFSATNLKDELPLDEINRKRFIELRDSLEQEGFRTLGIAWKKVPLDHPHAIVSDETELTLAGIAAFQDPPKADAKKLIQSITESGVTLKVITGDGALVSRHLFKTIEMEITGVLSGSEIQQMDDSALKTRVENVNLFCRVSPNQKNRIVLALKNRGHTVGYLGDGINDAPSLHSADVGISVEGAVDVAKASAEIILMKKDLSVLVNGIREGRRTHANIMKYVMMGTSSNFGNMFSMAGATVFLPFLPMLPLQILLNNFLYDISEITIPTDQVDEESTRKPRKWDIKFIHRFMWAIGLVSSLFDFLTFYILIHVFQTDEKLFHTGWFIESIATQVLVIFVIRTRYRPWQSRPSRALIITSLSVVFLACLLPYLPFAQALGFSPLRFSFYVILSAMVISYLMVVEIVKTWFYRHISTLDDKLS